MRRRKMKKNCNRCGNNFYTRGNFSLRCKTCRKPHIADYQKDYVNKNKKVINARIRGEYARLRREKFPEKTKARDTLNNSIKSGKIEKENCRVCSSSKRIHAHHNDYSKPLKVVWLCPIHHKKLHLKLKIKK